MADTFDGRECLKNMSEAGWEDGECRKGEKNIDERERGRSCELPPECNVIIKSFLQNWRAKTENKLKLDSI